MPVQHAVALVVHCPNEAGLLLAVRRPADDAELPGFWGLPAATLREGESVEDAARRIGESKLGVDVEPGEIAAQGTQQRPAYLLEMALLTADLRDPDSYPRLLEPSDLSTAYVAWRWARPDILVEAAQSGSLCCRLLLSHHGAASAEARP